MGTHDRSDDGGRRVSATDAAKNFGRLVDQVREARATYIVERGGTPVARISPITRRPFTMAEFKVLLGSAPRMDDEYVAAVERGAAAHNRPRKRRSPWGR